MPMNPVIYAQVSKLILHSLFPLCTVYENLFVIYFSSKLLLVYANETVYFCIVYISVESQKL